jgi:hypothetical protein
MTIDKMTIQDYNFVLDPKVRGTNNLIAAFDNPSLDFVILLASSAGVLGARGSSNYCAGNVYLDAVADAQKSSSARIMSLSLGPMKETGIVARDARLGRHIESQGFILLTNEELFTMLDYSIGPQSVEDGCRQIVSGFNGNSFEQADNGFAKAAPLLRTVMRRSTDGQSAVAECGAKDLRSLVLGAADPSEALALVAEQLANKLSNFAAVDVEALTDDVTVESLGMDSLVIIELKNWIARDLHVTLQPSEILAAVNVKALAGSIIAHMVVSEPGRTREEEETKAAAKATKVKATNQFKNGLDIDAGQSSTSEGTMSDALSQGSATASDEVSTPESSTLHTELPRLPVPNMDKMLESLLTAASCLGSAEELDQIKSKVQEFTESGSYGQTLHSHLEKLASNPAVDDWWAYIIDQARLAHRGSLVPFQNYIGVHHTVSQGPKPSAAERAATVSLVAYRTMKALESGQLPEFTMAGMALDTSTYHRMFSACREPGRVADVLQLYHGVNHIVVFSHGLAFKVDLKSPSWLSLKLVFEEISSMSASLPESTGIPVLTMDTREEWAEVTIFKK